MCFCQSGENRHNEAKRRIDMSYKYNVPQHTLEALDRYVNERIPTGDFLYAVLTNDLFGALGRADELNREHIWDICLYIYNELPSACWKTPEHVKTWLEGGRNAS
jgi:hypothetical protein